MRNRRLAGARLAANPLVDVRDQLKEAQAIAKDLSTTWNSDIYNSDQYQDVPMGVNRYERYGADDNRTNPDGTPLEILAGPNLPERPYPQSIDESFTPRGTDKRVHLSARAAPFDITFGGEIGDKPIYGDKESLEKIIAARPKTEYSLAWDVDGSYSGRPSDNPVENLRIARETQRYWNKLVHGMEDGALVSNSPVGASEGDYGRADLYMASGFGPVQKNGNQYGIIRNGRIEPLNPIGTDLDHGQHLARRTRMAGDVGLSDEMLKALATNKSLRSIGENRFVENSKEYSRGENYRRGDDYYDDYDYQDDDYEPPLRREGVKQEARRMNDEGFNAVEMRNNLTDDIRQVGLDIETDDLGRTSQMPAEDIQAFRDMQVAAINRPSGRDGVNLGAALDALNRRYPRRAPERITTEDLGWAGDQQRRAAQGRGQERFRRQGTRGINEINDLPADQRREALIELVRGRLESADSRGQGLNRWGEEANLPGKQASIKDAAVDTLVGDDMTAVAQQLYDVGDVETAREIQTILAEGGLYNYDLRNDIGEAAGRVSISRENNPEFGGAMYRGLPSAPVEDLPAGMQIAERRQLTPEQMEMQNRIERMDAQIVQDGNNVNRALEINPDGVMAALDAVPNPPPEGVRFMNRRQVHEIIDRAATQPGRDDARTLGMAIQQGYVDEQAVIPQIERMEASLNEANIAPAAPIRRNPMAEWQMETEVPGVGVLRRPNPFVPDNDQLIDERFRRRQDTRSRREARVMQTVPQGAGQEFDELNDLSTNRARPLMDTRPALQRGFEQMSNRDQANRVMRILQARDMDVPENVRQAAGRRYRSSPAPQAPTPLPQMFEQQQLPQAPQNTLIYRADGTTDVIQPSMRESLAFQDDLVAALQAPQREFIPERNAEGAPIMSNEQVQRYLGVSSYEDTMAAIRNYGITSPVYAQPSSSGWNSAPLVPDSDPLPRRREGGYRGRPQRPGYGSGPAEFVAAPPNMSMNEFRRWRQDQIDRRLDNSEDIPF